MIFDSHAHYDDSAFDGDREEVLAGLRAGGVDMVVDVSAELSGIPKVLELARRYDFIYATSGVHPSEVAELNDDNFKVVEEALKEPKVVAVGEIGLDYHYDEPEKELQKLWLARQIDLAKVHNMPIIIHSREAAADTMDMVLSENARDAGGVVHCFSYEKEMAARYLDLGFYIGIGGVLTYKNARKLVETAEYVPLERILLETDCPYLAPVPNRGQRNDSTMIKYVVARLSEIKHISEEEIIDVTAANARRMYRINKEA